MQLNELKPKHRRKERKRIGRGGKKGAYSGKGVKGQSARAGHRFQPLIRSLIKRYPKLRGYRAKKDSIKSVVINVGDIEKGFLVEDKSVKGEKSEIKINPQVLLEKRLIHNIEGRMPQVKILGKGILTKVLIVEDCRVSKKAREKIEKVGGKMKK